MLTKRNIVVPSIQPVTRTPAARPVKTQPMVTEHEEQVDRLIDGKIEIEAGTKIVESIRPELEQAAVALRKSLEERGDFTKTILVKGSVQNVSLSFTDAYAKIDVNVEDQLRQLLGAAYDQLFMRCRAVSVKDPETMLQLIADIQDKEVTNLAHNHVAACSTVNLLLAQLSVEEYLRPVPDFRKVRFQLRSQLSQRQNDALDTVVTQIANRPSLNVK